ncbi:MAG: FAD-dependent oxidoreductase [Robiginitomaculum sp.]|nr:FAD-dependent oxidoreductase [Robiginitomaculum sp.]
MTGNSAAKAGSSQQVIIIGGGLIGIATLYELSRRGIGAVLIEAENELAKETSFANGGMMTPSQSEPWNGPGVERHLVSSLFFPGAAMKLHWQQIPSLTSWGLQFLRNSWADKYPKAAQSNFALAAYSAAKTADILQQYQPDIDQSNNGSLKIFDSKNNFKKSLLTTDVIAKLGISYVELTAEEVIKKEPQLHEAKNWIKGGIYFADDSVADARKFALFLSELAIKAGGEIKTSVRVGDFISENGKVVGVQTDHGDFQGAVILCAGSPSAALAVNVGLKLPIKPVKGYTITLDAAHLKSQMPKMPVIDEAKHIAIVPIGQKIRIAGMAEFAGFDHSLPKNRLQQLKQLCARIYPDLSSQFDWETAVNWSGLRPMSADGVPFVGAAPLDGLWLNCGHGHLGWTMALGSACLLADMMTGDKPDIDPLAYRYGR